MRRTDERVKLSEFLGSRLGGLNSACGDDRTRDLYSHSPAELLGLGWRTAVPGYLTLPDIDLFIHESYPLIYN
jgi:hypothetical protein